MPSLPAVENSIRYDALGPHLYWQLDGLTPPMIDWFWSNTEKGSVLHRFARSMPE